MPLKIFGSSMPAARPLTIVADDYGIGAETSRGILEVGLAGRLTATVLMVNTSDAEPAVELWERAGRPMAMGWHPNLTLDTPLMPRSEIPSLVAPDGNFWKLGKFLMKVMTGKIRKDHVALELAAQHQRFVELIGHPPRMVNSHQHTCIFGPASQALTELLASQPGPKPYLRRVQEQRKLIFTIPGARIKRSMLNHYGRKAARLAESRGLPGSQWLIGVTDPPVTRDPKFWTRWVSKVGGDSVELGCHPGYADETLLGRDVPGHKYDLIRREFEKDSLLRPDFMQAVNDAGFTIVPAEVYQSMSLANAAA